jgi:uncharacterized DUF497 family protein
LKKKDEKHQIIFLSLSLFLDDVAAATRATASKEPRRVAVGRWKTTEIRRREWWRRKSSGGGAIFLREQKRDDGEKCILLLAVE